MNTNIKPFYIYTDKNSLYVKNINENTEKLASNIHSYSANIDDNNNIHILGIDNFGKIIHFFNNDGRWDKKVIRRCFNNTKNIKDVRLYIINNSFNLFIIEKYPLDENLYKLSHLNFTSSNYKLFRHTIDKVFKDNSSIYKLNIDELSNIVFQYKTIDLLSRDVVDHTMIFNSISKKWLTNTPLYRSNQIYSNEQNINSNIKSDIFEFCYSIKYKL